MKKVLFGIGVRLRGTRIGIGSPKFLKERAAIAALFTVGFLAGSGSLKAGVPVVHHLYISGSTPGANPSTYAAMKVNFTLFVWYEYEDPDGDAENGTTFQWYTYDTEAGTNKTPIPGATGKTFTLTAAQVGKYISVEVKPRDNSGEEGAVVEFRPWDLDRPNPVLGAGAGCNKAGGGTVGPANNLDTFSPLCSPRTTTWEVTYTGIDYLSTQLPRIYIDWGDDINSGTVNGFQAFSANLVNNLLTETDTFNLTNMSNQVWRVSRSHTYDYDGGSVASNVAGEACTYTLRASYGRAGQNCATTAVQTQKFTVWDTEDNPDLGTLDIDHDQTSAGLETGEIVDICEKDQSAVRVQDGSDFNCTNPLETAVENTQGRWIQWVYGTSTDVTTGAGADEKIIINGVSYDIGDLPVYGEVTYQASPTTGPLPAITDDIVMPTSAIAGETFVVTMRTWNTCNPLDRNVADGGLNPTQSSPFDVFDITSNTIGVGTDQPGLLTQFGMAAPIYANNTPVTRNYTIRIIDSPDPPIVPSRDVCSGESDVLTVTAPIGGFTYRWYSDEGLTDEIHQGTSFDPSDAQAPVGKRTHFWVTVESSATGNCRSEPTEVTLIKRPSLATPPTVTIDIPGNPTANNLCPSTSYTFTVTTAPADVTIQDDTSDPDVTLATEYVWIVPSGWTITSGQGTATITATSRSTAAAPINIVVSRRYVDGATSGSQCQSSQRTRSVTVRAAPTTTISPDPAELCEADELELDGNPVLSFGSIVSHAWTGDNHILDNATIQQPTILANTTPGTYNLTYTVTTQLDPGVVCFGTDDITVTVDPTPPKPTITPSGATTFCFGGSVTLESSTVLATTYQWYKDGVPIPGATSQTYVVNTVAQAGDYTVVTIGPTSTFCESEESDPVTVTVNPLPEVSNPTGGGAVCAGNPASDIVWQINAGTEPFDIVYSVVHSDGTIIPDVIVAGYDPTEATAPYTFTVASPNPPVDFGAPSTGTFTYQIVSVTDVNGCAAVVLGGTETVSIGGQPPAFDVGLSLSAIETCDADGSTTDPQLDFDLDAASTAAGDYTLRYRVNGSAIRTKTFEVDANGVPSPAITFNDAEFNTVATHTLTVVSIESPTECLSVFNTDLDFTVHPLPESDDITVTGTCSPGTVNINPQLVGIDATGNSVPSTFEWDAVYPSEITGGAADGTGNLTGTLTNTSNVIQNAVFTVTPTSVTGLCEGVPFTITVPINPRPFVDDITTAVCSGSTFTVAPANGTPVTTIVPAGTNYAWGAPVEDTDVSGGVADANEPTINGTLTNTDPNPQIATYTVTPTGGAGVGSCVGPTFTVEVTVNPIPVLSSTLTPPDICSGLFEYEPTSATTGATFAWSRAAVAGITEGAANGTGDISETLTNTTSQPINVTYEIITSANGCNNGAGQDVVVTVKPTPVLEDNQAKTICSGEAVDYRILLDPDLEPANTTFTWLDPDGAGPATAGTNVALGDGTTLHITDVLTNVSALPITITYSITPTADGCAGLPEDFVVTIDPLPVANPVQGPDQVCESTNDVFYQVTQNPGSQYSWTVPAGFVVSGGGGGATPGGGPGAFSNDYFILLKFPPGTLPGTPLGTISVVERNSPYGCDGPVNELEIEVVSSPGPVSFRSDPGPLTSFCKGQDLVKFIVPTPNPTSAYSWSVTGGTINGPSGGPQIFVDFGVNPTAQVHVTETNITGCPGTPATLNVTLVDEPVMQGPFAATICSGEAPSDALTLTSTQPATYAWRVMSVSAGVTGVLTNDLGTGQLTPTLTNVSGTPGTVVFQVTPTGTSAEACGGTPQNYTITVNPEPVVSAINDQTACPQTSVNVPLTSNVGGATINWTYAGDAIGIDPSGTGNISFNAVDNLTGADLTGIVTVTATSAGCTSAGANAKTFTITVPARPEVTAIADVEVCPGDPIGPFNFTADTGGGETFSWTNSNQLIGLVNGGTGNIGAFFAAANTTANDRVATITVTATKNGCAGPSMVFTVTVKPEPVVAPIANHSLCPGEVVNNIPLTTQLGPSATVSWVNDNPAIGLGLNGTGNISFTAATNNTGADIVANITVTAEANGCQSTGTNSKTFTITVKPTPIINPVSDVTVCSGANISAITFLANTSGGETFTWTNDNPAIGLAGGGTGNIGAFVAATNVSGVPQVANIEVIATKNGCQGPTETFTITVNPEPVVDNIGNVVVCPGEQINVPLASDVVSATLNWTNSNSFLGIPGSGTGDINYNAPANNTGADIVGTITVTASSNGCVSTVANTRTFTITIQPTPIINQPANIVVCSGGTIPAINFAANTAGGETFTWTNDNPAIGIAAGGTGGISSIPAPANTSSAPIVANFTVQATRSGCVGPQVNFSITINPEPVVNLVGDQEFCPGDLVSLALGSNVPGATINWTNSNTSIGLSGNGSGDILFTAPANTTGAVRTGTITVTATANGCTSAGGNVETFNITIKPTPVVDPVANIVVCSGETISAVAFSANTGGGEIFDWTNDNLAIGLAGSGSGDIGSYTAPSNTTGASIVATVSVEGTLNGCTGAARTFTITVLPEPVGVDDDVTICSDAAVGVNLSTLITGSLGAATYDINIVNGAGLTPSGGAPASGTGLLANAIQDDRWTNTTGAQQVIEYQIIPTSTAGCDGDQFTLTVFVDPEPVVNPIANVEVCPGEPINVALSSNVAGATMNWTNSNPLIGIAGSGTGDIIYNAPANNTGANIVGTITVTASSAGCTSVGANVKTFTITIKPTPVMVQAPNQTVCSDGTVAATVFSANTGGGETFDWANNNTTIGLGSSGSGNITSFLANTNISGTPNVATITVSPERDGCAGPDMNFAITVNPEPVVNVVGDQEFCPGDPVHIALSSDVAGATMSWTNSNPSIGLGANGTGNIVFTAPANVSGAPLTATINVTASANGCTSAGANVHSFQIIIKPNPVVSAVSNIIVCSQASISPVVFAANTGGATTFSWTNDNTAIGLGPNGTGDIAGYTAPINTTGSSIVGTITVAGTLDGCTGATRTFSITVLPEPVGISDNITVCSDEVIGVNLNTMISSLIPGSYSISITNNASLPASAGNPVDGAATATTIQDDAWTNKTGTTQDIVYTITPISSSAPACTGQPFTLTVHVDPEPVLSPSLNETVCSDQPSLINLDVAPGSVAAATYNIIGINSNGLSASAGNPTLGNGLPANEIVDDAWTNTGNVAKVVQYTVVPVSLDGCVGEPVVVSLTVNPEPVLSPSLSTTVCSDEAIGITLSTILSSISADGYHIIQINDNGLSPSAGSPQVLNDRPASEIADDAWTNTTSASVIVSYTIVPVSVDDCEGDPVVVNVTVRPEPVLSATLNKTVCSDEASGITLGVAGGSVGSPTYNITGISAPGLIPSAGNPAIGDDLAANVIADDAWTNTTGASVDVVYTVVPVSGTGCKGDPVDVILTVDPAPVVATNLNDNVCSDDAVGLVLNTATGSVTADNYNIISRTVASGLTVVTSAPVSVSSAGEPDTYLAADVFRNTTSAPLTVTYVVQGVGSINGCLGDQRTIVITIDPEPVVADLNKDVCSDDLIGVTLSVAAGSVSPLNYNLLNVDVDPGLVEGQVAVVQNGVAANYIFNDRFTNTTNAPLDVEYTVQAVSSINGCLGDQKVIIVTIDPEPVVSNLDMNVCSDAATGLVLATDNFGADDVVYNIISRTPQPSSLQEITTASLDNGVSHTYLAGDIFRNTTNAPLTVTYRVVPVDGANGCTGDFRDIVLTIDPEPVMVNLDAAICSGDNTGLILSTDPVAGPILNYNILTRSVATGLVVDNRANVPANGVGDSYLQNDAFTNTTNAPLQVVYTVVPVGAINGCEGNAFDIIITINPEPVVDDLDMSVCSDQATGLTLDTDGVSVNALNYNIVSRTVDASLDPVSQVTVPQFGVLDNYLATEIYRNTTANPLTVIYEVQPIGTISNCPGDVVSLTVTINPEPVQQPMSPVVCSDDPIGLVLATSVAPVGTVTYNILSRNVSTGLTPAATNVPVANGVNATYLQNDVYTNTGSGDLTVTYNVQPVSADGCLGDAIDIVVTIQPEPVVSPTLSVSRCSREPYGITLTTDGNSVNAVSYDITAVVAPGLVGAATVGTGLAANAIFNDSFENTTTAQLKVVYTIVPNGPNCTGNARVVEFTINPEPVINPDLDAVVCSSNVNNVNIANIVLSTNGTSISANNFELLDVAIPGTITPDAGNRTIGSVGGQDLIRNDKYRNTTSLPVDVIYEIRANAGGCSGPSEFITLTVNPEPVMIPGVAELCSDVVSGIIAGPDAGSATITQYELRNILKPAGLTAGGNNAGLGLHPVNLGGGQSDFLASDVFTNTTSSPLIVTYTIAPVAGACRGADQQILFTVNPAPALANLDKTVCSEGTSNIVLATTATSTPASDYDFVGFNVAGALEEDEGFDNRPRIVGDVNEIALDQFRNPTDNPLTVVYQIVPVSFANCRGPMREVVLTVEPEVRVVPVRTVDEICSNTAIDVVLGSPTTATAGTITFNYSATPSSGLVSGFAPVQNNLQNGHRITDVLVNNSDNVQIVTYRVTPYAAGAVGGVGCSGAPVDVVITVEPKPKLTVSPTTAAVCEDDPLAFTLTSATTPSTGDVSFFVLGEPVANGGVTGAASDGTEFGDGDVLDDVLSNPTATAQTVTYVLQPRAADVPCVGDAVTLVATVNPRPVVTPEVASAEICSGESIDIEFTYDVTNTIGMWTANADVSVLGASSGAGSLLFQSLFNDSNAPGNVAYQVVPRSPAGCEGPAVIIPVRVDPVPTVTATPATSTICDDDATGISLASPVAGTSFQWTATPSSSNITGATDDTGNAIVQTLSNSGVIPGSVLYQITPHGPGATACAGLPQPVVVTVAPPVAGNFLGNDAAICLGSPQFLMMQAMGQAPFTLVYSDGMNNITRPNVGNVVVEQIIPMETTTYTLISVTDVNGCQALPVNENLTVTVSDTDASFTVLGPTSSCSPFTAQFQYDQVAGTTYTWRWFDGSADSVYTATTNEPGKIVKHVYYNASPVGTLDYNVNLISRLDPSLGGCMDIKANTISVPPTITPAVFPDKTVVCSGESVSFFNQTMGAAAHRWFYRVAGNTGEERDLRTSINATYQFENTTTQNPIIYDVVYRAENGQCPEEIVIPITVYRGADVSFTEQVPDFIGGNATVTFTNTTDPIDAGAFRYEWNFGLNASPDTYNGTDPVLEIDYSMPGMKEVILRVTNTQAEADGAFCVAEERKVITIVTPPLNVDFTVNPKAGCFPVDVEVTSNNSTGDTFRWQVVDREGRIAATSNALLPVFHLAAPGTYDIFLEVSNSLTGQSATGRMDGIEVFENPVASIEARPTTLFVPDTELFTFNFTTGANQYFWDFGDGTLSEEFEPRHFYALEGVYTITLVAANNHGERDIDGDGIPDGNVVCYDTARRDIVAREGGLTKVPNAFTPSKNGPGGGAGNGFNDEFLPITRGVANEEGAFIMQVYDRWGTLIFESRDQTRGWDGYDRNGNLVPAGVYVFKLDLRLANGQRVTQVGDVTVIR